MFLEKSLKLWDSKKWKYFLIAFVLEKESEELQLAKLGGEGKKPYLKAD